MFYAKKLYLFAGVSEIIKVKTLVFVGVGKLSIILANQYDLMPAYCVNNSPSKNGTFFANVNGNIPIYD